MAANLSEAVADLKRHYDEVHVIGSLDLLQSLLRNRLVDRLSHWLYSPVLGSGRRVFAGDTVPSSLRLIESVTHPNGTLQLAYEPVGEPTFGTIGAED